MGKRGDQFGHGIQKPASVQNGVLAARYRQRFTYI
jgi:hypothetical protein